MGDPGAFRNILSQEAVEALENEEPVTALAVTEDDMAYGALAGYLDTDVFRIVSLYVSPEHRRKGVGRMLIETLRDLLIGEDVWMEVTFAVAGDDDGGLTAFLKAMDFEDMTDYDLNLYHTTMEQVNNITFFERAKSAGVTFDQLDEDILRLAEKEAEENNFQRPLNGLDGPDVIREASAAYVKDRKIKAYLTVEKNEDGSLFLTAEANDIQPSVLPGLLKTAFSKGKELFPPETDIYIMAVTKESAALVNGILPQAETILRTYAKPCIE